MKTIEELDLSNIVTIERYLDGSMDAIEKRRFLINLKSDKELMKDFKMVMESLGECEDIPTLNEVSRENYFDQFSSKKLLLSRKVIRFGFVAVLASVALTVLSALLIAYFLL